MRPTARRLLIPGVIVAALIGLWWIIPSEEQRIRRVLEQARSAVSADGQTADGLALLARVGRLTQCLTRDVEIQVDVFGGLSGNLSGVDEVRAAAAGLSQQFPFRAAFFRAATVPKGLESSVKPCLQALQCCRMG